MISDAYRNVLRATRDATPTWGGARRHARAVAPILEASNVSSVLDYGAGARAFRDELGKLAPQIAVAEYDPSVPELDALPVGPFDAVVCTHVLEHVEPELLAATLEEIRARARRLVYIEVPHGPAGKTLTDGRNAHLIQERPEWWLDTIRAAFPGASVFHWPAANPINTVYLVDL